MADGSKAPSIYNVHMVVVLGPLVSCQTYLRKPPGLYTNDIVPRQTKTTNKMK
jgi:hypothetical protein